MATCVRSPTYRAVPGGPLSFLEQKGAANIADSADEVRLRVREQLLQGASQIKLVGGGGVSSPRTTLEMLTFSELEMRAGVEAAADRNTYVAVHVLRTQQRANHNKAASFVSSYPYQ